MRNNLFSNVIEDEGAPKTASPVPWLAYIIRPYLGQFLGYTCFHLIRNTLFRLAPLFVGIIVGLFESGRHLTNPSEIFVWALVYISVFFSANLSIFMMAYQSKLSDRMVRNFCQTAFSRLVHFPVGWYESRETGRSIQKLVTARHGLYELFDGYYWYILPFPAILASITISVLSLDVPVYYIPLFVVYILVFAAASVLTLPRLKYAYDIHNKTLERITGKVGEYLGAPFLLKTFTLEKYVKSKTQDAEKRGFKARSNVFKLYYRRWLLLNFITSTWLALIVLLTIWNIIQGEMSIAAFSMLVFMGMDVISKVEIFPRASSEITESLSNFQRVLKMINEEDPGFEAERLENRKKKDLAIEAGRIEFRDIRFAYNKTKDNPGGVLNDLNLIVKERQRIGLVGASGAGKSTIVKLLCGFYPLCEGGIFIDGQDIANVQMNSLRRSIAIIPQDTALIQDTVMNNIRLGRPDACDGDVMVAARKAASEEFIKGLPRGYRTFVGERGVKLSGGQRQRIAIARAILKDAPILILDEATSALDSESEKLIQESLKELMKGKTVIAIAHRLSTIAHLDRLIVMDKGRIVEDGTHEDLLKHGGLYARLWHMQSGGFLGE